MAAPIPGSVTVRLKVPVVLPVETVTLSDVELTNETDLRVKPPENDTVALLVKPVPVIVKVFDAVFFLIDS